MKNKRQCFEEALEGHSWVNDTGAAVAAGTPVLLEGKYGVALNDVAAGAEGVVQLAGVFTFPAAVDAGAKRGDTVWWNGSSIQTNNQGGLPLGTVVDDQPTDDTQAWVKVLVGPGFQGKKFVLRRSPTAGEDTANSIVVTIPGLAAQATIVACHLVNSSGVVRHPTITLGTHTFTLTDANISNTDVLYFVCEY